MTEQEKKLYASLVEEGWFEGETEPEMIAFFDLSDRRIPPFIPKNAKKKDRKPKKAALGTSLGLILCKKQLCTGATVKKGFIVREFAERILAYNKRYFIA